MTDPTPVTVTDRRDVRIVTDGRKDPLTAPVLAYLERRYGMPAGDIVRVQLDSHSGRPQLVTVTLLVPALAVEQCPTCTSPDRSVRLALDWLGASVCRDDWHKKGEA
jgi:hypothetical protein